MLNWNKSQVKATVPFIPSEGVLRPAFQMAVDDDILVKYPFGFQLAGVLVNDAVTREAITKDQMRKFLKFVHDDVVYWNANIGILWTDAEEH